MFFVFSCASILLLEDMSIGRVSIDIRAAHSSGRENIRKPEINKEKRKKKQPKTKNNKQIRKQNIKSRLVVSWIAIEVILSFIPLLA